MQRMHPGVTTVSLDIKAEKATRKGGFLICWDVQTRMRNSSMLWQPLVLEPVAAIYRRRIALNRFKSHFTK